jgi:hypothetical protein
MIRSWPKQAAVNVGFGDVLSREPDAVISWTGRRMGVAKFIPHLRNEHALHRWDIAGDDEISHQLLGTMDLVGHSVDELGRIQARVSAGPIPRQR